ncbi:MAG: hypothetical protein SFZ03_04930 [Candidatus Melainabacteria bacterium]|nr:hypothetical protein [Candidatus Melainabacteria bacterium]
MASTSHTPPIAQWLPPGGAFALTRALQKLNPLFVWLYQHPGWALALCFLLKCLLGVAVSSGYETRLFLPFVDYFVSSGQNPWDYFSQHGTGEEFPYHPFMLYVLAAAYWPVHALGLGGQPFWANLAYKLPILVADATITYFLLRLFPGRPWSVIGFYVLSPILLYAAYIHSQLDLIPTALLVGAAFYLRRGKWCRASLFYGVALTTKLHVLAALPLFLIYLLKNRGWNTVLGFTLVVFSLYGIVTLPYLQSEGFLRMVLTNARQGELFHVFLSIGEHLRLYLPVLALSLLYGRFWLYRKVNADLLDAFLVITFALFVLLVPPQPAWYLWMLPFLSIFCIKMWPQSSQAALPYLALTLAYLLYFVGYHSSAYSHLQWFGNWAVLPQFSVAPNFTFKNLSFTLLEAILTATIVFCYRAGVHSNSIYRRRRAVVIGIGGDSGSGKTTLLSDLKLLLHDRMQEVEGDGDHKWERGNEHWNRLTHLDPKANYLHRQAETILALKQGKPTQRVEYDHSTGRFTTPKTIQPKDFVVLCGLHPFYLPKMRKLIDLKIYLDTDLDLKTHWKLCRDTAKRGYSPATVLAQIQQRAEDVARFIQPQKNFADLVVQYYAAQNFEPGNLQQQPKLHLRLTVSSSTHLEGLLERLQAERYGVQWDYAEDLETQYLILEQPVSGALLTRWAWELIPNLEEWVTEEQLARLNQMDAGQHSYRGFVQLVILMMLRDRMQEAEWAA